MLEFLFNNPFLGTLVVLLWISLILYAFSAFWWLFEVFGLSWGWKGSQNTDRWEAEDIQVRILTIGAENVVQATVNSVPDSIRDIQVIAEKDITITGAEVHVVPEEFECAATNKGRAVEWARQNVPCNREYVLYLDEDTLMTGFEGIPDADVVQFSEKPIYTGSRLAYLCEVFRVGYQFEQLGFHRLRYPLYAWGGGVAIRHEIEDEITWDVSTITEDTNFIWRAAESRDLTYRLVDARFRNQAPPSVKSLIKQRRRWISGTLRDGGLLPVSYRPLYYTRIIACFFALCPDLGTVCVSVSGDSTVNGTVRDDFDRIADDSVCVHIRRDCRIPKTPSVVANLIVLNPSCGPDSLNWCTLGTVPTNRDV